MKHRWLVGAECVLVCAIVLAFAFPVFVSLPFEIPGLQGATPHKLLLPLLVPLALVRWRSGAQPKIPWASTTWFFAAFALWAVATALVGPRQHWPHNARHLAWLLLAFVFLLEVRAVLGTRKGRLLLACTVAVTGSLLCLFGYLEMWSGDRLDGFFRLFRVADAAPDVLRSVEPPPLPLHRMVDGRLALSSTYSSPFAFALFGVWAFERLARRGMGEGNPSWRFPAFVAVAIAAAGIVPLSASRAALVQVMIGIPLAALLLAIETPARRRRYVGMALLVLCGVGLIGGFASPVLKAKLMNLSAVPDVLRGREGAPPRAPDMSEGQRKSEATARLKTVGVFSALQRVTLARIALAMAASNPVFGVGFANYRPLLYDDPRFARMFVFPGSIRVLDVYDAHSLPLTTLATTGLVGLGLLLVLAWVTVRGLVGAWRRRTGRRGAAAGLVVAAAAGVGVTMGFTLVDPMSAVLFALLIGAAEAATEEEDTVHPALMEPRGDGRSA